MLRIPGYRLMEELAAGSSGTVYRGVQETLGRQVAIKILRPGLFDADETRARFLREAKIQAGLLHPNLLGLFDAGFEAGHPYLVMELVQGGTLRDRFGLAQQLPFPEIAQLGIQLASGLAHAHAAGIVHRDLKPENVLLAGDGQAKIADFGLARPATAERTQETASGVILGTPGYMAPELLQGDPARSPVDVYALAVILYEAAAAMRPFEARDLATQLEAQLRGQPSPLAEMRDDLPAGFDALLARCLAPAPEERPEAASVAAALEALVAGGSLSLMRQATVAMPSLPRRAGSGRSAEGLRVLAGPRSEPRVEATVRATPRSRRAPDSARLEAKPGTPPGEKATAAVGALPARGVPHQERPGRGHAAKGERPTRRLLALALLPLAAALAALLLRQREFADVPAPRTPPPLPASLPRVPSPTWVASGAEQLALELEAPAPPDCRLSLHWSLPGSPAASQAIGIPPGQLACNVKGIVPGVRYRAELSAPGRQPRTFHFNSLERMTPRGAVRLGRGVDLTGAVLVSRGDRVALAWRQEASPGRQVIVFRDSRDGGSTWSAPETLSTTSELPSRPDLALTGAATAVAWETRNSPSNRTVVRLRRHGEQGFGPPLPFEGGQHDPGLTHAPDGGFRLVALVPAGGLRDASLHTAVVPLAGASVAGAPAVSGETRAREASSPPGSIAALPPASGHFPHVHAGRKCCYLVRSRDRLIAFTVRDKPNGRREIVVTRRPADEPGPWEPPRVITAPEGTVDGEIDAAADDGSVVVSFLDGNDRLAISRDAGATFSLLNGCIIGNEGRAGEPREPAAAVGHGWVLIGLVTAKARQCAFDFYRTSGDDLLNMVRPTARSVSLDIIAPKRFRMTVSGNRLIGVVIDLVEGLIAFSTPLTP